MEAASVPLHPASVRITGDVVRVDGLVVDDPRAVTLVRESADAVVAVREAIEVGARVLSQAQTAANTDFVKHEFERAARELDAEFVDRARRVAERLDQKVDEAFGPEDGHVAKALAKHFADGSAEAVQHKVRAAVAEVATKMREDLVRQFSSDSDANPLAGFQKASLALMRQSADQQSEHLRAMTEKVGALEVRLTELKAEKEKLEAVASEVARGTAKGRSYEEEVAAAVDEIAAGQGDLSEACGDRSAGAGGGGKKGDVLVGVDGCSGPPRGRIVFEVKNKRLSQPDAIRELDGALNDREADYAVLVVPTEGHVPARMTALREINGDKLVVTFDPSEDGGDPLALRVAYGLARARVLMRQAASDGVDGAAVARAVERALQAFEDVRRIKQQLTGAKTKIDDAATILDALAGTVKGHLGEVAELVREAEAGADRAAAPVREPEREPDAPVPVAVPDVAPAAHRGVGAGPDDAGSLFD